MRPQPWHIVVVVVLILLLFGAGKLPSLARNLGKSMRIFKSEVEELRGEDARKDRDEDDLDEPAPRRRARELDPREVDVRAAEPVRRADEDRTRRD